MSNKDGTSASYPAPTVADTLSPATLLDRQSSTTNPGAFPPLTPAVDFSVDQVAEPDVASPGTQFSTCCPVEDTSFHVVEAEERQMDSVAARRLKRSTDVDTAIKRVSRELQNISGARLAS